MKLPEKWIWLSKDIYPDFQTTNVSAMTGKDKCNYCVADFKKSYKFKKKVTGLFIRFSADTYFDLNLNGELIATGPVPVGSDFLCNDTPRGQHYSSELTLYPNCDTLDFSAQVKLGPVGIYEYSKGHGGFMLGGCVTFEDGTMTVIATDNSWLARRNGAFTKPFEYNACIRPDDWTCAEEIPDLWHTRVIPLPKLTHETIIPEKSEIWINSGETQEAIIETDRIYAARLKLNVSTKGMVRITVTSFETEIDHRSKTEELFFDSDGEYISLQIHSVGGLKITAENQSEDTVTVNASIIAVCYPVTKCGITATDNDDINLILDVCRHTLKYCRQHIHLDSPCHYEPLACTGDYYIETLMTLFSFGDMDLAVYDVIRTAELIRNNKGRMFHTTYSLIWVLMLHDVYSFTGNREMLRECEDALIILLDLFSTYVDESGIIENPPDYMFIDWLYIDGISLHHPPKALGQTCLNMFYFGALEKAAEIFSILGNKPMADDCTRKSESLKKAVNEILFDKDRQMYFEGLNTPTAEHLLYSQMPQNTEKRYYRKHANILAAYFGICGGETAKDLIHRIMSDEIEGEYQAYFAHYLLEAVYRNGLRDQYTMKLIDQWIPHVKTCSKGLTEGFVPPEPTYSFDHSHAWGGSPLYSLPLALTGFRMIQPAFREISFSPSLLGLKRARVEIPTPYGIITVTLEEGKAPVFDAPEKIKITLKEV